MEKNAWYTIKKEVNSVKNWIQKAVQLRHELHQHPELSGEEEWTRNRLKTFLQTETTLELHDMGSWFYGVYRYDDTAPTIAFRADIDALPIEDNIDKDYRSTISGVGHKCGHDGHAATLCALAMMVDKEKPDVNVLFLFQPAEETGEGAKECLSIFERESIDAFFAYHNYPGEPYQVVSIKEDTMCLTSKGLILQFTGKRSHASQPEYGINPSFAIAKLIQKIEEIMQSPQLFSSCTICTIVHVDVGERAFGISAGEGMLCLTIRSETDHDLKKLEEMICNTAQQHATHYALEWSYEEREYFPATVNHPEAVQWIKEACDRIQQPVTTLQDPFRASEDFGYFLQRVPGVMMFIGDGENYPKLHTEEFDFPDDLIQTGVSVWMSLIELWSERSKKG